MCIRDSIRRVAREENWKARQSAGIIMYLIPPEPWVGSHLSITPNTRISSSPSQTGERDWPNRAQKMAKISIPDPFFTPAPTPSGMEINRENPIATKVSFAVYGSRPAISSANVFL